MKLNLTIDPEKLDALSRAASGAYWRHDNSGGIYHEDRCVAQCNHAESGSGDEHDAELIVYLRNHTAEIVAMTRYLSTLHRVA